MRPRERPECFNPPRGKTSGRRRIAALATGATLVGVLCAATPRQADAALVPAAVATFIEFVKTAYSAYQTLEGLLPTDESTGPTLADIANQLSGVQSKIIAQMRSQRNVALKSQARTVFTLFRDLADNGPKDPTNASSWSDLRVEQQLAADAMFDIIVNDDDVTSSYELAPTYNALLVTGTGILRIKGQIWRRSPASWMDHHLWLKAGMEANYTLVGSRKHECYTGSNPGYRPKKNSRLVSGRYRESQLWTQKIANRYITTMTFPCGAEQCNDGNKNCFTGTVNCTGAGAGGQGATFACSEARGLDCAAEIIKPTFDDDSVVQIVRAGMTGIMMLSGGDDGDADSNDPLLDEGKFVDPYVYEPSCKKPWAYPQVP